MYSIEQQLQTRKTQLPRSRDLSALGRYLHEQLEQTTQHPLYIPHEKALLSRDGGVCPADGSRLTFDPFSPNQHRCDSCGERFVGERHHRAWVWRYQIWLSERAVHATLLSALGLADTERWVTQVLTEYATRYRDYPNVDNVLGPTRLFFSTYLESLWLIQIVFASLMLDHTSIGLTASLRTQLESVVDESSSLINSFVEGDSNRQVWNATAVLAAGIFLDDDRRITAALDTAFGIRNLLKGSVTEQGRWHEGENYHFFALRGFLLAAELARTVGIDLYDECPRLGLMYSAPLVTLFPDLTMPARGDSPFGVSVRQPRFAELWEVGYSRTGDERLRDMLAILYEETTQSFREVSNEIAEIEQNVQPMTLRRDRLGWKALWCMVDELAVRAEKSGVDATVWVPPGGPLVLRPSSSMYVALECDGTGEGHGHPDALHLTIWHQKPLQVDFGTGSYVDRSLYWYRSWLCHTGPVVRGGDGREGRSTAIALDTRPGWSWCQAIVTDFAGPGSTAIRSVIVCADFVVDVIDVVVSTDSVVDLPVHLLGLNREADVGSVSLVPEFDVGCDDLEQFEFTGASAPARLHGEGEVLLPGRVGEVITWMSAPGPPTLAFGRSSPHHFPLRSCKGPGRWVQLFSSHLGFVHDVRVHNETVEIDSQRGIESVRWTNTGVIITSGKEEFELGGRRDISASSALPVAPERSLVELPLLSSAIDAELVDGFLREHGIDLRRDHYRRSEAPYPGEGKFSARCGLYGVERRIHVVVDVQKEEVCVRPRDWPDANLDNEPPWIHADGVQLYLSDLLRPDESMNRVRWKGYVVQPLSVAEGTVDVHVVRGTAAAPGELPVRVFATVKGYRIMASLQMSESLRVGSEVLFNVVVNEMYEHRQRRAGQLALSGGGWVYLRGDREKREEASVGRFV